MGSTDVVFLLGDVIAHHNNTGNDIHEVRDARYSNREEQEKQVYHHKGS